MKEALKRRFPAHELLLFGCISKSSIMIIPKACSRKPNADAIKQVGEIFAFHVLLRHLFKLGNVMIPQELVNIVCSSGVSLSGLTGQFQAIGRSII